jgi:cytoskeletal protein RodZ
VVDLNEESHCSPTVFGEQLRRVREGAGLRIEDIVAETKVSKAIFVALEEGRFGSLPERVFCRSFVAQYARTIGVAEDPLLRCFDQAWDEYCASSGTHPNLEIMVDDLRLSIRWRFWIPIAAGVLILLIAATVILRGSTSVGERLAPDPRRSGARHAESRPTIGSPIRPTPETSFAKPSAAIEVDTKVALTVMVDSGEECWIHYRDRDGRTGQRLLVNGQQLSIELAGPIKLTVGNAGAVRITIDDRVFDDLGLPGQVIHTEVSDRGISRLGPEEGKGP